MSFSEPSWRLSGSNKTDREGPVRTLPPWTLGPEPSSCFGEVVPLLRFLQEPEGFLLI